MVRYEATGGVDAVGNRILTDRAGTINQRDLLPDACGNRGTPAARTTLPGSTCSPRTAGGTPQDRRGLDSIDPQPPARRRHTSGLGSERLAGKTAAVLAALSRTGRMQAQLALPVGKLWHVFGTEGRQEPSTAGVGRTHECGTGFPASRGQ